MSSYRKFTHAILEIEHAVYVRTYVHIINIKLVEMQALLGEPRVSCAMGFTFFTALHEARDPCDDATL